MAQIAQRDDEHPVLEVFKVRLDWALSNLVLWCSCSLHRGWTSWSLEVPSDLNLIILNRD